MGSPPRGRGKVQSSFLLPDIYGITPAWAGKREPGVLMVWQFQDHPRVGGEKILEPSMGVGNFGSPPRRRGKDKAEHLVQDHIGITPAQAGKRCYLCASTKSSWDHPRVGGEKLDLLAVVFSALGSPPRGRGKDVDWLGFNQFFRITPAWAGKSQERPAPAGGSWDHPRVGGEKLLSKWGQGWPLGSPPRGRGKVGVKGGAAPPFRITPAWAGKSESTGLQFRQA